MSHNSFGHLFRVTTWGESHGPAIGCVVDGCPPGIALCEDDIQVWLEKRKPGTSRFVTQRQESDTVQILSGVFEGKTTGTSIGLLIQNEDQRSKDYGEIKDQFRPSHADYTYQMKYGVRDYRGGGRQSARETAVRVAAGAIAYRFFGATGWAPNPWNGLNLAYWMPAPPAPTAVKGTESATVTVSAPSFGPAPTGYTVTAYAGTTASGTCQASHRATQWRSKSSAASCRPW